MADEVESILLRSKSLLDQERWDEHEALMRDAVAQYPENAELCMRAAVAQIQSRPDEARDLAHRAAALQPRDPGLLTRCASFFTALEDFDDADHYVRVAKDNAPSGFELAAELAYIFGRIAWARGDLDRAEQLLHLAFRTEPDGLGYGAWLARYYRSQARYNEALAVLDEALQHRPNEPSLNELHREVVREPRAPSD